MSKLLNVMLAAGLFMTAGTAMASLVNIGTLYPGGNLHGGGILDPSSGVTYLEYTFSPPPAGTYDVKMSADSNDNNLNSVALLDSSYNLIGTFTETTTGLANPEFSFDLTKALATGEQFIMELSGNGGGGYSYNITATPLPAAGLLFGTALLGMAGFGRKKGQTEQADAVAA